MPPSDRVIMRLQIERKNVMVEKEKRLGNQDHTQSVILPFRDGTVSGTPPTPFSRLASVCFNVFSLKIEHRSLFLENKKDAYETIRGSVTLNACLCMHH